MGVPLAIMAFGAEAAIPMALILMADTIVLLALVAAFVAPRQGNPAMVMLNIIKTMISNPLLISLVFGVIFAMTGMQLPVMLDNLVNIIAGAAAPTALFALGMTLYGQPIKSAVGEISMISLWRLIMHPVILIAIFALFPGPDMLWINVAILSASLPVAANVYMLAQHYNIYVGRAATSCLISTIIATITVPLCLYLLIEAKMLFLTY
jgi:predicted permease